MKKNINEVLNRGEKLDHVAAVTTKLRADAKNFIVTGGSRGLGKCVARALAAQGASAVLLTARSAEAPAVLAEFAKDYPDCRVAYVSADGAEPEAGTAKILEAARELFGVGGEGEGGVLVHGLVNVAGVAWPRSNLEQVRTRTRTRTRTALGAPPTTWTVPGREEGRGPAHRTPPADRHDSHRAHAPPCDPPCDANRSPPRSGTG